MAPLVRLLVLQSPDYQPLREGLSSSQSGPFNHPLHGVVGRIVRVIDEATVASAMLKSKIETCEILFLDAATVSSE